MELITPKEILSSKAREMGLRGRTNTFESKFLDSRGNLDFSKIENLGTYAALAFAVKKNTRYNIHWETLMDLSEDAPTYFSVDSQDSTYKLIMNGGGELFINNYEDYEFWNSSIGVFLDHGKIWYERKNALEVASSLAYKDSDILDAAIVAACTDIDRRNREVASYIVSGEDEDKARIIWNVREYLKPLYEIMLRISYDSMRYPMRYYENMWGNLKKQYPFLELNKLCNLVSILDADHGKIEDTIKNIIASIEKKRGPILLIVEDIFSNNRFSKDIVETLVKNCEASYKFEERTGRVVDGVRRL